MNMRVHVIGIGSPFGDDRLGWEAAEFLRRSGALPVAEAGFIEISLVDHPGSLLTKPWKEADGVILLDAVRSGAQPGTRHRFDAGALAGSGMKTSSHGIGIAEAVGLVRALGRMPSRLLFLGVEADPAWTGFSLSPAAGAVLPGFCADVIREAFALRRPPDR